MNSNPVIEIDSETLQKLLDDQKRLNWLDKNIFSREPDEWDRKYGACRDGKTNQWVMFAPKTVQGSARAIIDGAMSE
jgi:hypothetical protein